VTSTFNSTCLGYSSVAFFGYLAGELTQHGTRQLRCWAGRVDQADSPGPFAGTETVFKVPSAGSTGVQVTDPGGVSPLERTAHTHFIDYSACRSR